MMEYFITIEQYQFLRKYGSQCIYFSIKVENTSNKNYRAQSLTR